MMLIFGINYRTFSQDIRIRYYQLETEMMDESVAGRRQLWTV